ncbi:uncharacterized protein N7483_005560 [Penicillium malachiteum]|uniref:uncharacterized protein n=1 Tax=Penicillium malachiteum TaxID=1324776 RepID=UPI0025483AF8|nr:uncharacterized protein N7483_005560 [Penicillium malachiteum]KAJ5731052.1 hypothetical protein N7483_005560 [Penicillium malachiteum]
MTGPGSSSPSSPWVHTPQGGVRDGRTPHSFHPTLSPATTGIHSSAVAERASPNYFGITVGHSSNSPNSNPGPHAQKNWGPFPPSQSLPSPTKLQLYSQESMSEGLINLLRAESEIDKGRRESALQGFPSGGNQFQESISIDHARVWSQGSFSGMSSQYRKSSLASVPETSQWISADRSAELLKSSPRSVLLLDVRPFAHYSKANIRGSLNLCIPTTLLKRRSFDTQKLEGTFTSDHDKRRFTRWRECNTIIVYDSATADVKDAVPLLNVINKFQAEGWNGEGLILQGGFKNFSGQFPDLLHRPQSQATGPSTKKRSPMSIDLPSVAPVVGGCALPDSASAVNPFFGNIRQNMDLVGGVGQIPLKLPRGLTQAKRQGLPVWLRNASDVKDQGQIVSERFLDLEKTELQRMKQALSYEGSSASAGGASKKYRVAGIEKGTKNRYNDIYPFEHSRVRLEGVSLGECDYVNANHIQAEFSNRRYIATQAPVPDTFNDFWRVIWEQDVRVLVSLTAEIERGQVKCHPYWRTGDYGPFKVKAYSEQFIRVESNGQSDNTGQPPDGTNENPVIIVRHFSLYHTAMPFQPLRDITQLQYPYWPDFGTTSQPTHLLALIEQCNKAVRASSNLGFGSQDAEPSGQRPILVHCSAGCGRTGTFCTVDSVLDMLKRQRASQTHSSGLPDWINDTNRDLILKAVEDFRTQRPSMVQNLSQYVLCYESVLEWLVSRMDNNHNNS